MMGSGSRGPQGQEDEGWANASPDEAERGFAGRSEAANPAGNLGVCAQGQVLVCRLIRGQCICSNKGFCNSKHLDKRWDIELFDGNQIPVPNSPSQTTNGSSSGNLRKQGMNVPWIYQGF